MVDEIKRRLDGEWSEFLVALEECYADAKEHALGAARKLGNVESLDLVVVDWADGERIHVGLAAIVTVGWQGESHARAFEH